jgi:membrane-associated protease RseP (regulator of RpoE activity)
MQITSALMLTPVAMLVHEFGHVYAARQCNVSTSEISLGLGRKLFGLNFRGVLVSLRSIPLGSFVRLDGTSLNRRSLGDQICVHLGGIFFNLIAAGLFYGTLFGWINLLLAIGNLLPLYQHDGWKCAVVIIRALMRRTSQSAEWALTFSGGFLSFVIGWAIIRAFI